MNMTEKVNNIFFQPPSPLQIKKEQRNIFFFFTSPVLSSIKYLIIFFIDHIHGLILDGCSFDYAHTWSKSGFSICWRHLITSKESSNPIYFHLHFHHSSAMWNEQPSNIKTMVLPYPLVYIFYYSELKYFKQVYFFIKSKCPPLKNTG